MFCHKAAGAHAGGKMRRGGVACALIIRGEGGGALQRPMMTKRSTKATP